MKKVVLIVLCFTIALMFCSCNFINPILRNNSNSKGSYVLCDRQKKILKQEGLPLDYEKLDDMQKSAIECIEDIFKYLDKTYPKEKYVIRTANIYILLYYYYNFLTFIFIFYFII